MIHLHWRREFGPYIWAGKGSPRKRRVRIGGAGSGVLHNLAAIRFDLLVDLLPQGIQSFIGGGEFGGVAEVTIEGRNQRVAPVTKIIDATRRLQTLAFPAAADQPI